MKVNELITSVSWNSEGLAPCIVQSVETKRVLMMAWMNVESLALTLEKKQTVFFSRSRQEIWHKGASSGNVQRLVSIALDCDNDTLLAVVSEAGPACHTGSNTCFDDKVVTI